MARRKDHTREQLKEIAIIEASKLIEKNGLSKFSIRDVAKQIGYTPGTLYQMFRNVDDLIIYVNAKTLDKWLIYTQNYVLGKDDRLRALINSYIDFAKDNLNLWLCLFEHRISDKEELPEWFSPKMEILFKLAEEAVYEILPDREKAKIASEVIWSSIHGMSLLHLSGKLGTVNASSIDKLVDNLLNNYFNLTNIK